jgi:hypothetical protein
MESDSCELLEVIHNKKIGQKYTISGLKTQIAKQCNDETEICYNNFIGPVIDHKENYIFYISTFKQDSINITDFTIIDDVAQRCTGHIFALVDTKDQLRNPAQYTKDGKAIITRVKSMVNIGSKINKVYVSPVKANLGLVLEYTEGDQCPYDLTKRYSSYFIITCDKGSIHNSPKYVGKSDNCTFVFVLTSKYGCPICIKEDVETMRLGCINGHQNIMYHENFQCITDSTTDNTTLGASYSNNNLTNVISQNIINNCPALKYYYSRQFTNGQAMLMTLKEYDNKTDDQVYVASLNESVPCNYFENIDNSLIILVIVLPSIYLIVTILVCVIYCKYKRIRSKYQILRNEVDNNSSPREAELAENIGSINNL